MEKMKKHVEDAQGADSTNVKRGGSVSYSIKAIKDHLTVLLNANVISIEKFNMIDDVRKSAGGEWLKKQMGL